MRARASAELGLPAPPPAAIGPLLTRLRLTRGLSQLRLAQRLCAAANLPTVTRHEVSRWERGERIPGSFWLGWLAVVLEAPLEELEAAVAVARQTAGAPPPGSADPPPAAVPTAAVHRLWQPPTAAELRAALDRGDTHDLRELVHVWLAGPPAPATGGAGLVTVPPGTAEALDRRAERLAELRRMDDLIGGLDLVTLVDRELREMITHFGSVAGAYQRQRALRLVAEFAQLAGWVRADAGQPVAARRAYRVALRAAAAGGDRPFAGHVLGALSQLSSEHGDPQEALLLARSAHAGTRAHTTPGAEALLLHRVALAAAHAGDRRSAHAALRSAERVAHRADPGGEPAWLYWLDRTELTAMSGRCLVALGRPLWALPKLAEPRGRLGPRTAALYECHLARTYLQLGEYEHASRLARRAMRHSVAAGSHRAATLVRRLHPLLVRHRDLPAVRAYERIATDNAGYLPGPAGSGRAQLAGEADGSRQPPAPTTDSVSG